MAQPDPRDLERLNEIADLVRAKQCFLVSQARRSTFSEEMVSCGLRERVAHLREELAP